MGKFVDLSSFLHSSEKHQLRYRWGACRVAPMGAVAAVKASGILTDSAAAGMMSASAVASVGGRLEG